MIQICFIVREEIPGTGWYDGCGLRDVSMLILSFELCPLGAEINNWYKESELEIRCKYFAERWKCNLSH